MKTLKSLFNYWLVDLLMFGIVLGLLIFHSITDMNISKVLWIVVPYVFVAMFRAKYLRDKIEELKDILRTEGYIESLDDPDDMI